MTVSDTFQSSFYYGNNIQNILYGIELVLYYKTMGILLSNRRANTKAYLFYALFSSIMVFGLTVWIATAVIFGEKMWLVDSNFPGGPDMYWKKNISVWYMAWAMSAVILVQLMTDGLRIYRCWIIWDSYRAIVVPIILWLSTLVFGVLSDCAGSLPGGYFFSGSITSQFGLAYYSVSVLLNTVLTCTICYRIVQHGRRVRERLGPEYASSYFAIVTLIIESILPSTLSGIAFLVSLGIGSPTSVAFISVYFPMMVCCISPQLLILLVIVGRAWDKDTNKQPGSSINFSPDTAFGSEFDSRGARVHLQTLSNVHIADGQGKVAISQV
ncbi:hypothetical protein OG21DRAFT_1414658 [Imleria badia]|nr:hypothetical protein OG21DRAFT_1414658 [Imleria badia]